jgi:hypothetical protein
MTREEAFMIAVSEEAETSLERLGDAVPDDEFAKLTKNINDFVDSSKKAASETGGLISLFNDYIDVVKKNNRQSELLNDAWRQGRISGAEYSAMIRASGEDVDAFVEAEEKLIAAMKAEIDIRRGMMPDQQEMSIWIAENTGNLEEWTEEIIKANKAAIKFANQGLGQIDETLGKATRSGLWKVAGTHIQGIIDSLAEDLEPVLAEIPDQLTLFNENLEDIGPTMVMIGGRTGDQNRILSEAQRRYDAAGQAIHDYQVGLRGFGKSADDVNEIIEDLTDEQAHWNRLIDDYGNIQGEATLATVEATRNQEAINAAFFEGIEVTEENKLAVLGMKVATGELTEAQAAAIIEQWNMEEAIRAIQAAWVDGAISDGQAVRALEAVGQGHIDSAADADVYLMKIGAITDALLAIPTEITTTHNIIQRRYGSDDPAIDYPPEVGGPQPPPAGPPPGGPAEPPGPPEEMNATGFVIHQTFNGPTDPKAVRRATAGAVAEILGARG